MKMIVAIIKPFKLDEVRDALAALGVQGMTVTEVRGYGRQKGQVETYRAGDFKATLLPKIKIELAVEKKQVKSAVAAIQKAAGTGRIGDGKIFVYKLDQVIRIRTGEKGRAAL